MPKFNVCPTTPAEFSSKSYWNQFYANKKNGFEWYGAYHELSPLLRKCISPRDNILIVGCGNSDLSQELYLAGFENQINIDNSHVVIAQMKKTYPHLIFRHDDVTNLQCLDQEISCILDKGTFDALAPPPAPPESAEGGSDSSTTLTQQHQQHAFQMLREVNRVLKDNGRFVCISLLQIHVAEILFDYFINLGWIIRISRCEAAEKPTSSGLVHPVYVCVFTKLKFRNEAPPSLIEFIGSESGDNKKGIRLNALKDVIDAIHQERIDAFLRNEIKRIGYASLPGREFQVCDETTKEVKYIIHLVDNMELSNNPIHKLFGVFIVPQGRETEYVFSRFDGHLALSQQAGVARLAVVHLLRDRIYPSLEVVQNELADNMGYVMPMEVSSVPGYTVIVQGKEIRTLVGVPHYPNSSSAF